MPFTSPARRVRRTRKLRPALSASKPSRRVPVILAAAVVPGEVTLSKHPGMNKRCHSGDFLARAFFSDASRN